LDILKIVSHELFARAGLELQSSWVSASWVTRISDVSYRCPADVQNFLLSAHYCPSENYQSSVSFHQSPICKSLIVVRNYPKYHFPENLL
jgi:hypothetical protein